VFSLKQGYALLTDIIEYVVKCLLY